MYTDDLTLELTILIMSNYREMPIAYEHIAMNWNISLGIVQQKVWNAEASVSFVLGVLEFDADHRLQYNIDFILK